MNERMDRPQDTIFVNSLITDLDYPIGGCYQKSANLTLQEFPVYALEGGADVGDAWIYVSGSEVLPLVFEPV